MNIAKGFDNEVMHVGILYLKLAASKSLHLHLSAYILCAQTKTHMQYLLRNPTLPDKKHYTQYKMKPTDAASITVH